MFERWNELTLIGVGCIVSFEIGQDTCFFVCLTLSSVFEGSSSKISVKN